MDFLHPERLSLALTATTLTAAIAELVEVVARSMNLDRQRQAELLRSTLEREAQVPTCLGEGIAVPHGALPNGEEVVGALGIHHAGLDATTPDGKAVHFVLLLATPPSQRQRHVEVLATVARTLGMDPDLREKLLATKTAAAAMELLNEASGGSHSASAVG